jgi:hypothetical protein
MGTSGAKRPPEGGRTQDGNRLNRLLHFDEDALSGALFSGFNSAVVVLFDHVCEALGSARVRKHLATFTDVGQAIVEQCEHGRGDLLAQAIARAQVLIDPYLHTHDALSPRGKAG